MYGVFLGSCLIVDGGQYGGRFWPAPSWREGRVGQVILRCTGHRARMVQIRRHLGLSWGRGNGHARGSVMGVVLLLLLQVRMMQESLLDRRQDRR